MDLQTENELYEINQRIARAKSGLGNVVAIGTPDTEARIALLANALEQLTKIVTKVVAQKSGLR